MRLGASAPLGRDPPPQVAEDALELVVAQLGVGLRRAGVERDVEVDIATEQLLDVLVGEDLANQVRDVALAIYGLAINEFMTGKTLVVDGGRTLNS